MSKEKKTVTVLKVPTFNPDDESKNTKAELEIEILKFKNNGKGGIGAFTNAAELKHLNGKPVYLDMSKMLSVFADENNMTIISNGTNGWSVAEDIGEVIDIWKKAKKDR
jgi:hypothetical protein